MRGAIDPEKKTANYPEEQKTEQISGQRVGPAFPTVLHNSLPM